MILDATAGNRMMWSHAKRRPPHTIFIDVETELMIPPDVFADNTYCPFRDGVFDLIIFDPPWGINMPPWWTNPSSNKRQQYGNFKTKRELLSYIHKAQKEFQRLTTRLCMKWGERNISLWNILPLFTRDGWKIIYKKEHTTLRNKSGKSKTKNYWITFVREDFPLDIILDQQQIRSSLSKARNNE